VAAATLLKASVSTSVCLVLRVMWPTKNSTTVELEMPVRMIADLLSKEPGVGPMDNARPNVSHLGIIVPSRQI